MWGGGRGLHLKSEILRSRSFPEIRALVSFPGSPGGDFGSVGLVCSCFGLDRGTLRSRADKDAAYPDAVWGRALGTNSTLSLKS